MGKEFLFTGNQFPLMGNADVLQGWGAIGKRYIYFWRKITTKFFKNHR